ncbi:MAG: response regulator [Alphaproteobacteria bacterium]|nr:response regulator [Alphaproteobacteria bacterium]
MKIMVVDGDELFARLMRTKLQRWGHRVVVERDGTAAFERIRKEPFRMVVLDWDLPGMDGPDLCARIRKLRRARYTYIIFYTGKLDKDSLMAGLEAGADDYMTKPLNTIELRLRIKNGKRLLNLEDELCDGAGLDRSTNVVNRAKFRQFFRVALAEAKRTKAQGTLLYVDIDNYAEVYDRLGYNPAENMMTEAARLLTKLTRESDLVARVAPERFCVLLQNTVWDRCQPVTDKVHAHLGNLTIYVDEASINPRFTLSVVNYPQAEQGFEQILDEAPRTAVAA